MQAVLATLSAIVGSGRVVCQRRGEPRCRTFITAKPPGTFRVAALRPEGKEVRSAEKDEWRERFRLPELGPRLASDQ
ncbi:hypothetical protein MRX96_022435 [Rhipicephalus microplus]